MAKIKKTKNALKAERESLARFHRFLPTLELKKQQLQSEVRRADGEYREKMAEEAELREQLKTWVKLFSQDIDPAAYTRLTEVRTSPGNIAGVAVPLFEDVAFSRSPMDLYATPAWLDDAVEMVEHLTRLRVEQNILAQQRDLLGEELRITSQRVNLFEKVKIPETQEHIRVIQIALGDAQTAGVVRAKIAKGKTASIVKGEGAA